MTAVHPYKRTAGLPAPLAPLLEPATLLAVVHSLLNLPVAIVLFTYVVTTLSLGAGLLVTVVGLPVLVLALAGCRLLGAAERARVRLLLGARVAEPEPPAPRGDAPRLIAWCGAVLRSGSTWRQALYALVHLPWAVFSFTVTVTLWSVGLGLLTLPAWYWSLPDDNREIHVLGDGALLGSEPFELAVCCLVGAAVTLGAAWTTRGMAVVDTALARGLLGPSGRAGH
ncbi:sensor domain-containing protein [Streptomyces abyssomicinicus]|uniref:sensor domain-containing protein n=1 Tax=Streptomyces abyssomicinicus TaxID=574929 RepID=UPI001250CE26|nr:sensor domain-containing protein [Streptomyces abyssomicinicus]